MPSSKVSSKGQITIPAEVRRSLGLTAGSRVDFVRTDKGSYELIPASGTVTSLKGCVPAPKTPVTLEQMDAAAADGAVAGGSR